MKKLFMVLFTLVLLIMPIENLKAEQSYYTITVYAGNQGTFSDGSYEKSFTVEAGKDFTIRYADFAVSMENDKYYARGLKESGRDNDTTIVEKTYAKVDRDMDFVVTYGIKGEMVSYTVIYVDEDGNELASPSKFHGMIGDKPIVAATYIEGYLPSALNVTKTLSQDESQNVFRFTYYKNSGATTTIVVPGEEAVNPTPSINNPGAEETIIDNNSNNEEIDNGNEEIIEPIEIDDQDTPLAQPDADPAIAESSNGSSEFPYIAAGVGAGSLVLLGIYFISKKRREEKEEA